MKSTQLTRGRHLALVAGLLAMPLAASAQPASSATRLPSAQLAADERFMRMALVLGRQNPRYPYGCVIVQTVTGRVIAQGVNHSSVNPMLHGEIAALDDYLAKHGNRDWGKMTLYTTAEPCAMCAGAIVWTGIARVVFGTSIPSPVAHGVQQLQTRTKDVFAAAPFYDGTLTGGVLAAETDKTFF
jgi:tRNA(adenine34) deaminase